MFGFLSKIFGGSKSEKDTKKLLPVVEKVNQFYQEYQSLNNDQLRAKTAAFRERIADHLKKIDEEIAALNQQADALSHEALLEKDQIYKKVDDLKKDRDKEIEKVL